MARATRDLLDEALALPPDERARMAADLLESLHDSEEDVEAAWAAEIDDELPPHAPATWKAPTGVPFSIEWSAKFSAVETAPDRRAGGSRTAGGPPWYRERDPRVADRFTAEVRRTLHIVVSADRWPHPERR